MVKTSIASLRAPLIALALLCAVLDPALARTRAVAAPSADSCVWDRPGHNPFMGDVVAAVDRYDDLSPEVRERLKARMVKRAYDDIVTIRRDSITGKGRYGSTIRDMHFGTGKMCHSVTRAAWEPQMQERGLVYCEGRQCILVPTVCRNVSRITRAEVADERAEGEPLEPAGPPVAAALPEPAATGDVGPLLALNTAPTFVTPLPWEGVTREPVAPATFAPVVIPDAAGLPSVFPSLPFVGPGSPSVSGPSGPVTPVPEPEVWGLMLVGAAALEARRRRVAKAAI